MNFLTARTMKSFSLRRVAHYARYHYSVTRFNYLSFIVAVIALPVLFGILDKSLDTTMSMLIAIYIFGGVSMAVSTTRTMRGRGTKIMDGVLPVSSAERQVFNVFNLAVVYSVLFAVLSALILGVVAPFHVDECPALLDAHVDFCSAYEMLAFETFLQWPAYVFVQIICSTSLLINIFARRSLIFAYTLVFIAFVGSLTMFVQGVEWMTDNVSFDFLFHLDKATKDILEYVAYAIYALIPVVMYALGYVALRKRQVKW